MHRGSSASRLRRRAGPSRLPVARSRKLPSKLRTLSRGSGWSSRRLWTRRVRSLSAWARERNGVSAMPGGHVGEQFHPLADRGQLRERAQEESPASGPGSSLRTDSRSSGRSSGSPEQCSAWRVRQELPHMTVVGRNGWEPKRRLAGRWPDRLIHCCTLCLQATIVRAARLKTRHARD